MDRAGFFSWSSGAAADSNALSPPSRASSWCENQAARRRFVSCAMAMPASVAFTTTTFSPAIVADAAFVPCAEDGIRQTVRPSSPRAR